MIPYGRQDISQEDKKAVLDVLCGDFLTQGPAVEAFETSLIDATGAVHAVAVNSATSALHIACLALDLGPGDTLWTAPNTFVATANVGRLCGADVDFVDIDPDSYCMSADALEARLATSKPPKVLIPVHFAGQSCDMARIHDLARPHGIRIIEDASHAIGATYKDRPVGNCRFSDIAVFSFHPVKIVTTGEGGATTTNDPALADRMKRLRSHGVTKDAQHLPDPDGPWDYAQIELGLNYRMTDIQAALGVSQMTRLGEFVERRHQIRARYDTLLAGLPVIRPVQHPDSRSALHLYPVQIDPERTNKTRAEVFAHLHEHDIRVQVHYIPVHTQPYYRALGFKPGDFPVSERYYAHAISLPMFPTLTDDQQDEVVAVLAAAFA